MRISQGVWMMLASVVIFSLNNVLIKYLSNIPAVEIITFRAVTTIVLASVAIWRQGLNPFGHHPKPLIARGIFGAISLITFVYTLQLMPLATATVIHYLSPIFTVLFSWIWLKERVTTVQLLCFVACFVGVLMIKAFDPSISLWLLAVSLFSAIFAALAYTTIRQIKGRESPQVIIFYFSLITIPTAGSMSVAVWVMPIGLEWLLLFGIGILMHSYQWLITLAYQKENASISGINYLGVAFAILWGFLFFGEIVSVYVLAGIGLIVIGVLTNVIVSTKST